MMTDNLRTREDWEGSLWESQMTDDLRTRIQEIVLAHGICSCGEYAETCSEHAHGLAGTLIRELEADYVLVPKGHTHARIHAAREATNASDFQDDDTECDTTWVAPGEVAKMMGAADE